MDHLSVKEIAELDFDVRHVGSATLRSPVRNVDFVPAEERVSFLSRLGEIRECGELGLRLPSFEAAGPRETIYHDPSWTKAAIVTCGGLCPGINDVVKSIVNTLHFQYGVRDIFGIRYGYRGLVPEFGLAPIMLDPGTVDMIHERGGSVLGSSRGEQSTEEIVNTLERLRINVLFAIGGDGTQRGVRDISEETTKRNLPVSVIGVPKTIDNDLSFMDRTFGYETAIYRTGPVISSAHDEAKGTLNGIGLVKLMGRESGFIAASACLANSVANFCLIPEVPFELDGERGLLKALERRLEVKDHAVIVVAEGAGQEFFEDSETVKDKSGNIKLMDIGQFLKHTIGEHLSGIGVEHSVKYFDPSYLIRSVPAHGTDAIFCLHLGANAVHAAMAGRTGMVVGHWNGHFTHVPVALAVMMRRKVNPSGPLWKSVLGATQQQTWFRG